MAEVIIALGSNLNNPLFQIQEAYSFLQNFSNTPIKASAIYSSEPVGPSEKDFLNAVVSITTNLEVDKVFEKLREQEKKQGRPSRYPKWTARIIDLDIIAYDNLVIETDTLVIPHKEYSQRLFVLKPLRDIKPDWKDPQTLTHIDDLIISAPEIRIKETVYLYM